MSLTSYCLGIMTIPDDPYREPSPTFAPLVKGFYREDVKTRRTPQGVVGRRGSRVVGMIKESLCDICAISEISVVFWTTHQCPASP